MNHILKLLIVLPFFGIAQIPTGYYNSAQGLTGNPLKIALHNIIDNHTVISYANLWNAFQKTDKKTNGKVWDIYSDVPGGTPPYEYTFITDQCGNTGAEGVCYNREHSWPQSWFNSVNGPYSDLFHIYPTDGKVNGARSNYPYGNVSAPTYTSLNGGKLGSSVDLGYSQTVFEPIDEYKGDLARGFFYMSTRYYSEDAGWSTSGATNKATILPWQVNVLLQWHHDDPVSAKEIARNDSIYYRYQNNRNPFIDNPQWADSIWKIDITVFVEEVELTQAFSISPNPAKDVFYLINHSNSSENATVIITDISGKLIEQKIISALETININCSEWQNGIYFIKLNNSKSVSNLKFIKQ